LQQLIIAGVCVYVFIPFIYRTTDSNRIRIGFFISESAGKTTAVYAVERRLRANWFSWRCQL